MFQDTRSQLTTGCIRIISASYTLAQHEIQGPIGSLYTNTTTIELSCSLHDKHVIMVCFVHTCVFPVELVYRVSICEVVPGSWLISLKHGSSIWLFSFCWKLWFCGHACVPIMGILWAFDQHKVYVGTWLMSWIGRLHHCNSYSWGWFLCIS